jgi:1-aminocyclopropane-1-carboxylate deaminase/D-cysteine desulfhydrase-like pyridoxal-dependent ACC family enzyme
VKECEIVRILSKKLIIALMAITMATFPALRANAQAGTIAGLSVGAAATIAAVVVVAVAASDTDSGRPDTLAAISTSTNATVQGQTTPTASSTTTTN